MGSVTTERYLATPHDKRLPRDQEAKVNKCCLGIISVVQNSGKQFMV